MPKRPTGTAPIARLRRRTGLTQTEFWNKLGITQSGGSRYERGCRLPAPVAHLADLIYTRGVDVFRFKTDDLRLSLYLREHEPELHNVLRDKTRRRNS